MPTAVPCRRSAPASAAASALITARPRSLWPCQSTFTSSPVASTTSRMKRITLRAPLGVACPTVSATQTRRAPASTAAV